MKNIFLVLTLLLVQSCFGREIDPRLAELREFTTTTIVIYFMPQTEQFVEQNDRNDPITQPPSPDYSDDETENYLDSSSDEERE